MGRGVLLLAVALAIGVFLLNKTDDEPPGATSVRSGGSGSAAQSAGDDDAGDDDDGATTTSTSPTTTVPVRAPKDVKVLVANASEVKGAAGKATDALKVEQYNALAPTNATGAPATAVYFSTGFDREAAAVARVLGLPPTTVKPMPTPPPIADIKSADVFVSLGADHAPRFASAPATGSPTTTAAPATTTTTVRR